MKIYGTWNSALTQACTIESTREDLKNGVIHHEIAHVWQWYGNGKVPMLLEGIADFVRLKARYLDPNWVKPGGGEKWDEGYAVTAYINFLDYCNSLKDGFVADWNGKMRNGYSDELFVELLGKTVDQLWKDYRSKYAGGS